MTQAKDFVIQLLFDQRLDGRFHVHSPDVPGLHLAGKDLEAIRADIMPALTDILFHNAGMVVDEIAWHPSLEDVIRRMKGKAPPPGEPPAKTNYLVIVGHPA